MQEVRLNKFLAEAGVCSRREADRLIAAGQVTVDGKRAETGMKVLPTQEIRVGKKTVQKVEKRILLIVNKPVGIVCTEEKREKNNIIKFLNYPHELLMQEDLIKIRKGCF
nr:S4 domain-containing protein [Coprococcus sp. AF21-14LB]